MLKKIRRQCNDSACICGKKYCNRCYSTKPIHDCNKVLKDKQEIDYAYRKKMEKQFQDNWLTKMFKRK